MQRAFAAVGLAAAALVAALLLAADARAAGLPTSTITLVTEAGSHQFTVELADTFRSRAVGLMYRTELAADRGMLFDFKTSRQVAFWMKNTYVSLDMIFIRADGRIAGIAENTVPLSLETVSPGVKVRFVLEVVAGTAKRIGLKKGDRAEHPLFAGGR